MYQGLVFWVSSVQCVCWMSLSLWSCVLSSVFMSSYMDLCQNTHEGDASHGNTLWKFNSVFIVWGLLAKAFEVEPILWMGYICALKWAKEQSAHKVFALCAGAKLLLMDVWHNGIVCTKRLLLVWSRNDEISTTKHAKKKQDANKAKNGKRTSKIHIWWNSLCDTEPYAIFFACLHNHTIFFHLVALRQSSVWFKWNSRKQRTAHGK